jgi:hypothetical protein
MRCRSNHPSDLKFKAYAEFSVVVNVAREHSDGQNVITVTGIISVYSSTIGVATVSLCSRMQQIPMKYQAIRSME